MMLVPMWVNALLDSIDDQDADAFVANLTDDCRFRCGNDEPLTGTDAVRDAVARFFAATGTVRHEHTRTWVHTDSIICQFELVVTLGDSDAEILIPAAAILYTDGDLAAECLIYADLTPVCSG